MADARTLNPAAVSQVELYGRVLRNTYMLLGMTLAWSAVVAYISMALQTPPLGFFTLIVYIGLLFAVHKTANSTWGLFWVFALTGFLGFTLGPILSYYMATSSGSYLVAQSLGLTALVFIGLSAYALITRKDFSFLSGFLIAGGICILAIWILSVFIDISGFQMAISAGIVLFASALILWQTSAIVHGGETNYIVATVGLYVAIYNLFLSLLSLLGMGDD